MKYCDNPTYDGHNSNSSVKLTDVEEFDCEYYEVIHASIY